MQHKCVPATSPFFALTEVRKERSAQVKYQTPEHLTLKSSAYELDRERNE